MLKLRGFATQKLVEAIANIRRTTNRFFIFQIDKQKKKKKKKKKNTIVGVQGVTAVSENCREDENFYREKNVIRIVIRNKK